MKVLKIENGKVEICDEQGKCEKAIEADAVSALFNPSESFILITLKNGDLEVYDKTGKHLSTFHVDNVESIKWEDRDIRIKLIGDKTEVRDLFGNLLRTVQHQHV